MTGQDPIEFASSGRSGSLARVSYVGEDGLTIFFSLLNGNTGSVTSSEPIDVHIGDIVLISDSYLEKVPDHLWPEDVRVGVVKIRLDDVTVVDAGGRWELIPSNDLDYRVGNTVEISNRNVVRVLHESAIRLIDVDDLSDADVEAFRSNPSPDLCSFDLLGGLESAIARARELIELPLLNRERFEAIGARRVRGVLFTGPPGTGKTMMARIIASRSNATFYDIRGPEIFSKWYGQSEELLRLIFQDAKDRQPSIIFIDEIDSVASRRSQDAHESTKRIVAQLLTLIDGFETDTGVILLAATNRPGDLDPALRRPGRLDWEIEFPLPTENERLDIVQKSSTSLSIAGELPFDIIASKTEGWSGAELVAIWTEAALLALSDERDQILPEDFLGGWQRVSALRLIQSKTMSWTESQ